MSASSGYPPLFQPSTAFPVTTLQMPPSGRPPRTLRDVAGALWRQWRLVLACAVAALVVAGGVRAAMPPVYYATATVLLQPEPREFVTAGLADTSGPGAPDAVDAAGVGRRVRAEIELMRSRLNAQAAVERLDLHESQFAASGLAVLLPGNRDADEAIDVSVDRARTVDRFLEALSIEPTGASMGGQGPDMLQVRLACTDRWIAARALQAFLDSYQRLAARHHRRAAQASSRVLEARVADARGALRRSEDAIVGLLLGDAGRPLVIDPPRAGPGAVAPASPPTVPMALHLDDEPAVPAVAHAPARARPAPADDAMASAADPMAATDSGLRLDDVAPQAEDEFVPARNPRDRERRDTLAPRPAPPLRVDTPLGAQLARLEQQHAAARDRYADLQRQLDHVDDLLDARGDDPASRLPTTAPRRPTTIDGAPPDGLVLPGVLLGLLAGIAVALLRELGGDRLRSARDVRWALGVPVLGALPTLSARSRQALVGPAFVGGPRAPRMDE